MKIITMIFGMMLVAFSLNAQSNQNNKSCCGMAVMETNKSAMMKCPMKSKLTVADMQKMMQNCPMMKGLSAEEKRKMMQQCPMKDYVTKGGDTTKLTKEELQKMIQSCPMMKKGKGKCPMMKACPMMNGIDKDTAKKLYGNPQTHCPVMQNNEIDKSLYTDVKGKRIYVCCPSCISAVNAEPDKYIKKLEAKGVKLEEAP